MRAVIIILVSELLSVISLRMSHAAVIPRDVFLFQLLAVAQAYVVLTDHLLRP